MSAHATKTAEELLEEHHGFVALLANRMADLYHVDVNDLIQQGNLGILRAMKSYNPAFDCKFLTYARHWMLRRMQEWVWRDANAIRVPGYKFGKVRILEESLSGFATLEDDAFERCVAVEETVRETADKKHIRSVLETAIGKLTPAEVRVIRGYYYEGLNSIQLADRFGITHQGVNMAKSSALKKLRGMKLIKEELAA